MTAVAQFVAAWGAVAAAGIAGLVALVACRRRLAWAATGLVAGALLLVTGVLAVATVIGMVFHQDGNDGLN